MKVLFKNKTTYTKSNYRKYLEFHEKKFGRSYYLYTILISILFLFCLIMQIKFKYYSLFFILILAFFSFLAWRFLHPISEVKKELKKDSLKNEKEFSFIFYEKTLKVICDLEYSEIPFRKFKHIYETKDFFYLYVNKNHALLVSKEGFIIGNKENFSKFIKNKCNFRYRKINF